MTGRSPGQAATVTFIAVAATLAMVSFGQAAAAADHPLLVSVEATRCTLCHEDLLADAATVHPPVADDCTTCHDFTISEEDTQVALMAAEPELCLLCHDQWSTAAAGEVEAPHFPVTDSCLTCHDPHASPQPRLLLEPLQELCGFCHDLADLEELHGDQLTAGSDCTRCHQPHGSNSQHMLLGSHLHPPFAAGSCTGCHRAPFGDRIRLRSRGERLCTACHGNIVPEAGTAGSVHAALKGEGGRAGCLSCHDPHMSDAPRMLLASGPEVCAACHGDVVAKATAEGGHYPAAEDCVTCHQPHSAEQPHLLNAPVSELCPTCHDVEDAELAAVHLGAPLADLTCTRCHTPHGEGNPKLLARTVHPPVLDGCDLCHEGAFDQLLEAGESSLCLLCHDDIGEIAEQAEYPHGALELARCADCHNPHASAQPHLIKLPDGRECFDCHDDKFPDEGETAHGVIGLIGCRACHEPHGGSRPALLRKSGAELCLSCHDPRAVAAENGAATVRLLDRFPVPATALPTMLTLRLSKDGSRGHPVAGHRVLGTPTAEELKRTETTFTGELTCLTCHNPHKGRSPALLRWDAVSSLEACQACHPK